jgi:cell division protein FtsW
MLVCGIIGLLMFKQPSTTTPAIILAGGLIVYFASGARMSFIAGAILTGLALLTIYISLFGGYRADRIKTYIKSVFNETRTEQVDLSKNFHIDRAKTAISSGGLLGIGFGKSTIKYNSLPEAIGDSIFAVIAEELGFVGASLTIAAFIVLIGRGFSIAKKTRDKFPQLAVIGIISIIAIQTFIHIGAISGVIPLTGVSLPFVSYGGTSLAVFLTMSGLVVKISKYT